MPSVKEIQEYIANYAGINLEPCEDFSGLNKHRGETYYNFLLKERVSESQEFFLLQRIASNTNLIYRVEPNGLNRVAVFFH